jgi:cytoskeletal protein CcmA (bactofilin family)
MGIFSNKLKPPPIRTLVGEGTVLTGEVRFSDGIRVDGEVRGDVIAVGSERNMVVISDKARVQGKVKAGHVIINGEVHGPVQSDELLELQPKAKIFGDVRYHALEMHQGATISGELRPLDGADRPALKLAASGGG